MSTYLDICRLTGAGKNFDQSPRDDFGKLSIVEKHGSLMLLPNHFPLFHLRPQQPGRLCS